MNMPWYIFAAATPTLYSVTNYVDKFLIEKKIKDPIAITALSCIASGIIGLIIGIFKGFPNIGYFQITILFVAGILLTFYLIPYFEAMKIEDASTVVPLFQFIPVFTLILSTLILKESLSSKQIIGMFFVVFAGISISVNKLQGQMFKPRKSLYFMLLASFMYGLVGIIFRFVVKDANFWTTLSYEYIGSGIGGILLFLIPKVRENLRNQINQIKTSTGIITLNNGIAISAQISESYALSLAAVPLVNIIGSVQPAINLIEGIVLTKKFPHIITEDITFNTIRRKFLAIIFIFGGLYLVYF
jgi:drug/metabolite transporter (DMT)-like permease